MDFITEYVDLGEPQPLTEIHTKLKKTMLDVKIR